MADEICRYEGPYPYVDGLILQVTQSLGAMQVAHVERRVGKSGYTLRRLVNLWLNLFLNFSVVPLRVSAVLGLVASAVGFLATLVVVAEALFSDTPRGWGSLMSVLLLFCGVQLLTVGLVGEYVGRMYLTANRRPQSVIRSVLRSSPAAQGRSRRVGTHHGRPARSMRCGGKRVVITGGLGFIGSNLARRLVQLGADVLLLDSLVPEYGGNLFNIAGIEDRVTVNISDVRDQHSLRYLVRGRDYLFNLAGQTSHLDSMQDPFTDLEINCRAQLSILEACRACNPAVKIVFASTRQIYGAPGVPAGGREASAPPGGRERHQQDGRRVVPHPLQQRARRCAPCALRLTNTIGPRMRVKDARQTFVGVWVRNLLEGRADRGLGRRPAARLQLRGRRRRRAAARRAVGRRQRPGLQSRPARRRSR